MNQWKLNQWNQWKQTDQLNSDERTVNIWLHAIRADAAGAPS